MWNADKAPGEVTKKEQVQIEHAAYKFAQIEAVYMDHHAFQGPTI